MLAERVNGAVRRCPLFRVAGVALVLLRQELHREMNAVELASGHRKIARLLGPAGEHQKVIVVEQAVDRDRHSDFHVRAENDALDFHLFDAAVDDRLFELEIGNAVTEQAADPVRLFEDRWSMSHPRKLLGAGEPGRA